VVPRVVLKRGCFILQNTTKKAVCGVWFSRFIYNSFITTVLLQQFYNGLYFKIQPKRLCVVCGFPVLFTTVLLQQFYCNSFITTVLLQQFYYNIKQRFTRNKIFHTPHTRNKNSTPHTCKKTRGIFSSAVLMSIIFIVAFSQNWLLKLVYKCLFLFTCINICSKCFICSILPCLDSFIKCFIVSYVNLYPVYRYSSLPFFS
jgi:hypothetical protein